jgi:hypothetical protein
VVSGGKDEKVIVYSQQSLGIHIVSNTRPKIPLNCSYCTCGKIYEYNIDNRRTDTFSS